MIKSDLYFKLRYKSILIKSIKALDVFIEQMQENFLKIKEPLCYIVDFEWIIEGLKSKRDELKTLLKFYNCCLEGEKKHV